MSPAALYTLGFFALLAALVYGAILLNFSATSIVIGALVANVVGILWASSYTTADGPPPR